MMTYVILRIALDLLEPTSHVGERGLIGDVVGDDNAVGATVVGRGDRPARAQHPRGKMSEKNEGCPHQSRPQSRREP